MPSIENRKHARISVSVPVYFSSLDGQGTTLSFSMGVIRDVSQTGVALEVYSAPESELVLLSFIDVSGTTREMRGKTVYSKNFESGLVKMGVMLLGSSAEIISFVKELVRFHHYTKKSVSDNPY
jgi:hypothetical protein